MKQHTWFAALSTALLAALLHVPTAAAEKIWITNVKLVSPEKLDRVEAGSVLVEDGRIAAVQRGPQTRMPAGARLVDGKGYYLTPGLIDSHVHLHAVPGMSIEQAKGEPALAAAYQRQLPRSFLYYGYTTVVDLAVSDMGVIERFRAAPLHPEVVHCGQPLPMANGYPMSFLSKERRFDAFPNFVQDPAQPTPVPPKFQGEDHSPRAGVARARADGAACVKTHFERGFGAERKLPVWSKPLFAEVRAATTAAGLVLVTHANSFEGQQFAVDGKADVLAHGMWHWGSLNKSPGLPDEIRALLDRIIASGTGYQPTMRVLKGLDAYFDPAYLRQPGVRKVVPKALADWFGTPQGKWFGAELSEGASDGDMLLAGQAPLRRLRQVVAYQAGRDATNLFGTATPSTPTNRNQPRQNGFLEMPPPPPPPRPGLWGSVGGRRGGGGGGGGPPPPRAATINNARAFGILDRAGTIEPGKTANLLLMKDSPLASTQAYDSIVTLWVGGKQVERARLAAGAE
jgi:imidazolonepropionase-like amidohydrolase